MLQPQYVREHAWANIAWVVMLSIVMLIALAFGYTTLAWAILVLAGVLSLTIWRAPSLVQPTSAPAHPSSESRMQCVVTDVNGQARPALLVPAAQTSDYRTVLTMGGYALVNANGQVVRSLCRDVPVETASVAESGWEAEIIDEIEGESEPVVVVVGR